MSRTAETLAVKKLIELGKERGYLTYEEVNNALPADILASDVIDDMLIHFEEMGIEVVDHPDKARRANKRKVAAEEEHEEPEEEEEEDEEEDEEEEEEDDEENHKLALAASMSSSKQRVRAESDFDDDYGKTNDPVRMYLRKMGSVSLLTREGEVEIAKRIEEGSWRCWTWCCPARWVCERCCCCRIGSRTTRRVCGSC
jgi:RNA polymerase primary sigma factor